MSLSSAEKAARAAKLQRIRRRVVDNTAAFFEKSLANRGLLGQWVLLDQLYDAGLHRNLWRRHLGDFVGDMETKIRQCFVGKPAHSNDIVASSVSASVQGEPLRMWMGSTRAFNKAAVCFTLKAHGIPPSLKARPQKRRRGVCGSSRARARAQQLNVHV